MSHMSIIGSSDGPTAVFIAGKPGLDCLDTVFSQTKFWQADYSCDITDLSVFTEWNHDAALSAHIIWTCIWCGTCLCNLQESDRIRW